MRREYTTTREVSEVIKDITEQEMLELCVKGLRLQGFRKCLNDKNECCYFNPKTGRRCAWGWIDASLTEDNKGDIVSLYNRGVGTAASLTCPKKLLLARQLQFAHDCSESPADMESKLRKIADLHNLKYL